MAAADICLSLRAICSGDSLGSLRIIMCIWSLSVYPADEQRVLFAETFGCCRFVYNWALNLKITAYKERKETLGNVYLTNLMKSEPKAEHEWLSEISSQSLQSALRNPDTAYTDFFRNTHAVGFPRFKSRKELPLSAALACGFLQKHNYDSQSQRYSSRAPDQIRSEFR